MNINISYDQIESTTTQLASARENIVGDLDKLKVQIDNLVQTGFVTGSASQKFQTSYERYNVGAKTTIQGLDEVIKYLKNVIESIKNTDSQLAASLNI